MSESTENPRLARRSRLLAAGTIALAAVLLYGAEKNPPWTSGIEWPKPKVVDPGPVGGPPSDAIVLFDGKDLSKWQGAEKWKIQDGYAIDGGNLTTRQAFGDCQLHVEWASPPEAKSSGQGRGNSGVYLMSRYEVQVLDSYENDTYYDGQAGAIYKQRPPLVNACRKPGEWQTYDIVFKAPRFDDKGKLLKPAIVTLLHNGVLVLDHFELLGQTEYRSPPFYKAHEAKLPLYLQGHGCPVRFRNIWIRELPEDDGAKLLAPLRAKVSEAAAKH